MNDTNELSKNQQIRKVAERLPHLPDMSFKTGNYGKAYRLGKDFYLNQWRGKEKSSPAFQNRIVNATRKGFGHLVGKTVMTNYGDATKRLSHLPNAKQILEKTDFIYETTKEVEKTGELINRHVILGKLETGDILKVVVKEQDHKLTFTTVYVTLTIKRDNKETQA